MRPHGHFHEHGHRPHGFQRPFWGWRRPHFFRPFFGFGLIGLFPLIILLLAFLRHP